MVPMDTKTNRSEFVANAWMAEKPAMQAWQKPAPKRVRAVVKRSIFAYLKALFK